MLPIFSIKVKKYAAHMNFVFIININLLFNILNE